MPLYFICEMQLLEILVMFSISVKFNDAIKTLELNVTLMNFYLHQEWTHMMLKRATIQFIIFYEKPSI